MTGGLHCVGEHLRPTALGLFILAWAAGFWAQGWTAPAAAVAVIGIAVAAFRSVCRVDPARDLAAVHWGLFGLPLVPRRHTDAASIRAVKLRRETRFRYRAKKSSPYEVFVIELQAAPNLKLRERRDFGEARVFAEQVARRLELPLLDASTGRQRRRDPETLDLTLGQRLRLAGKEPAYPTPPAGSGLRFRDRGRVKQVTLPAQPLPTLVYVLGLGIPGLVFALAWFTGHQGVALWVMLPLWLLFSALLLATVLPRTIRFGPDDIRVRWLHLRQRMPFDELEEVVHARLGIYLLSDRKRLGLPYDFKDENEARFVVDLIEYLAWQHPSSSTPGQA